MQPAVSLSAATGPGSHISNSVITGPCTGGIHVTSTLPVRLAQNTIWAVQGHGIALLPPHVPSALESTWQLPGHAVLDSLVGGCVATGLGLPSETEPAAVAVDVPGCTLR